MKTFRLFMVGVILAGLGFVAYVTWHLARGRSSGPAGSGTAGPGPAGSVHESFGRGTHVWRTTDGGSSVQSYAELRRQMVEQQLVARDITDLRVLETMQKVPRHEFVPPDVLDQAYLDGPLSIDRNQTISQPYIVALMTQLARPAASAIALDVGTGSGYQAAVLAELCQHVYSIEIIETLADSARTRLTQLGYDNVTVRCGDGYTGWVEHAPYDLIIVAAAPEHIPQPLIDQLKPGGRLVIPVGRHYQSLVVVEKEADGSVRRRQVIPVAFVPMTGQAQQSPR